MNKKRLIPIVLVLLAAGVILKITALAEPFVYTGTLEATLVDISSRVTSIISEIKIQQGDFVQKGQLLLKMSCEDLALEARLIQRNFNRAEKLFKEGSQAKEAFEQMQNRLDDALLKFSWCEVKSPLQGTLLTQYHEVGEMVTPGTKLFTVANLQDIYAYVYVAEPVVAKLKLGEKWTGYLPELDMKAFEGVITEIGSQAEFTPKNVQTRQERERLVYAIKVSFKNSEGILKPGMSLELKPLHE